MARNPLRTLMTLASLWPVWGCGAPEGSAAGAVACDSAGIRIVESLGVGRRAAAWRLDPTPTWSVGEIEGDPDDLLSLVEGAVELPDGLVLIANRGTNELRFYDADGRLARTRGGEGEGPGEFQYVRGLGLCRPGGFVAFDLNWQMNAYDFDGTFVDKTVMRAPDGITPYELACDPHGHIVLIGWGRAANEAPREGFYQRRDRLVLTDRAGAVETELGTWLVSERIGSQFGSRPHPAGRATVFALHDDRLYVGSGERFEVAVRELDGRLASILRGPDLPLAVTDALRSAVIEREVARAAPERRPAVRVAAEGWEWPERFPAYTAMHVDATGVVWLRAFSADPRAPEVWGLMDPERGYLGDVELPALHTLLSIGPDHVLALGRDELDVERVVRLRLLRG